MAEPSFLHMARVGYDTMAVDYAARFSVELAAQPLDRALLTAFAELVRGAGAGPVADLGCGPGHVTAYLYELGLTVFGVDLSPGMVAVARRAYPHVRFDEGSMTALDLPDATLGGIVAWYSITHVPTGWLPAVFAEFHRVLAPGGQVILAFQVGDAQGHRDEAFGRPVSLDYWLRPPERLAESLVEAGLTPHARLVREPGEGETVPRAYLMAGKPAAAAGDGPPV